MPYATDTTRNKLSVHHPFGCGRGRYGGYRQSLDPRDVTCRACLRYVLKHRLRPRSDFPDVPTFEVRAEGRYRTKENGRPAWGCHLVFRCPVCGRENVHGGLYRRPGAGDGHRASHCDCWDHGYYIREVQPFDLRFIRALCRDHQASEQECHEDTC
jgi:hypothetical protein